MPLMETFSPGMVKQSPAPQHHSPAALRNPPRLIQRSCADASEPFANTVPTKPTRAIDRSVIAVPPASNAALSLEFLDRHTGSSRALRHRAAAAATAVNGAWNFIRAPAFRNAGESTRSARRRLCSWRDHTPCPVLDCEPAGDCGLRRVALLTHAPCRSRPRAKRPNLRDPRRIAAISRPPTPGPLAI